MKPHSPAQSSAQSIRVVMTARRAGPLKGAFRTVADCAVIGMTKPAW